MKKIWLYLVSATLIACQSSPQLSQKEQAKQVLNQGIAAYNQQQYVQALDYFQQANQLGHMKAERYIGLSYLNGYGVAKDPNKAFAAFQSAAAKGDITSQYWLGYLYENGIGTTKNLTQAVSWYQKSATRTDHIGEPAREALKRLNIQ
ncbi:tetratricopeptide repeat protein [Glaesserella sp.]|uniref:tetratricopeptide repeat protein n=1 Tax=Glaesserella sp. TaxID=2094731 RepID=UPI0035A134A0